MKEKVDEKGFDEKYIDNKMNEFTEKTAQEVALG